MKMIVYILFFTWITWAFYLSAMQLKTARDQGKLTPASKVFGYPFIYAFVVLDVLFNLTIGTLFFLELPKIFDNEWYFTSRVSRLNKRQDWRGKLARFFCTQLLDPFDPAGKHCS